MSMLFIDPSHEVKFDLVAGRSVERVIRLQNNTTHPVAFKVKTTAPKRYFVRPSSGLIEAKTGVTVRLVMQAQKTSARPVGAEKDKFLIQASKVGAASVSEVLRGFESEEKAARAVFDSVERTSIQERKLACSFAAPPSSSMLAAAPPPPAAGGRGEASRGVASGMGGSREGGSEVEALRLLLESEKQLTERLASELRQEKKRALELEEKQDRLQRELRDNEDTVKALEELQGQFKALQAEARSKGKGESKEGERTAALAVTGGGSSLNSTLLLMLITLLCVLFFRLTT